jgi:hypothetical protein
MPTKAAAKPSGKLAVPVLQELLVHRNWTTLITYCQLAFPYGQLTFELKNAIPAKLDKRLTKPSIRFDVPDYDKLVFESTDGNGQSSGAVVVKVPISWVHLIMFCRNSFPFGQFCVQITDAEPRTLVMENTLINVSFDHPETIPAIWPF